MSKLTRITIGTLLAAMSCVAIAAEPNCAAISDAAKRLTCYDAALKKPSKLSRADQERLDKADAAAERARLEKEGAAKAEAEARLAKSMAPAQQALKALKKLNARVSVGVSYKDYPQALSETKYEVELFTESPAAKDLPEAAALMKSALKDYEEAYRLWRIKFDGKELRESFSAVSVEPKFIGFLKASMHYSVNEYYLRIIESLEDNYEGIAGTFKEDPGVRYEARPANYPKKGTWIDIDRGVAIIWAAATGRIGEADVKLR